MSILKAIDGKKTYITGAGSIAYGVLKLAYEQDTDGIQWILGGLAGIGWRSAYQKQAETLVQLIRLGQKKRKREKKGKVSLSKHKGSSE